MRLFPRKMMKINAQQAEEALHIIDEYIRYMQRQGEAMATELNKRFDSMEARIAELEEGGGNNGTA